MHARLFIAFDGDLFNRRAGGRSVLAVHLLVVSLNLWLAVRARDRTLMPAHVTPQLVHYHRCAAS